MAENGSSGVVVYMVNSSLYIANCGDCMAVLSRNGSAVPLSASHKLTSHQTTSESKKKEETPASAEKTSDAPVVKTNEKNGNGMASSARKELTRIRHSGGFISHDGVVWDKSIHTRSFGFFHLLPHVNAAPYISVTELTDADEFVIIGSAAFWNNMDYQMAVDVARLKADDALEAAMVLRDFSVAYSPNGVFTVDNDTELPETKFTMNAKKAAKVGATEGKVRFRKNDALTVMVINVKDWLGGKPKKVFTKLKRRKDETVDSVTFYFIFRQSLD